MKKIKLDNFELKDFGIVDELLMKYINVLNK